MKIKRLTDCYIGMSVSLTLMVIGMFLVAFGNLLGSIFFAMFVPFLCFLFAAFEEIRMDINDEKPLN